MFDDNLYFDFQCENVRESSRKHFDVEEKHSSFYLADVSIEEKKRIRKNFIFRAEIQRQTKREEKKSIVEKKN